MATAALVIGILSLPLLITVVGGVLAGALALILGIVAVRRMPPGTPGRGRAVAGIVTGSIALFIGLALVVVVIALLSSHAFETFRTCLNRAGSDQSAITRCEQRFARRLG
jgi:hypothetical protein